MSFEMIRMNDFDRYFNRGKSIVVDLRENRDYAQGHIPSAVNLPYETTRNIKQYLTGYQQVFFYCYTGAHSLLAARQLQGINIKVYVLNGNFNYWRGTLERS